MERSLNIGIFAHIDAGKTTLTERLLCLSGARRAAGSVDGGTAATDFLAVERRRGISVRAASVLFSRKDCRFSLIDTPGHADFAEEAELALSAVDVAVLVISAAEGIQSQTEILLDALRRRHLPAVLFLNQCDRAGARPLQVCAELKKAIATEILPMNLPKNEGKAFRAAPDPDFTENAVALLADEALLDAYLAGTAEEGRVEEQLRAACSEGKIYPLLYGCAVTGEGCERLLDALAAYYSFPRDDASPFSAFVYQVEHRPPLGKLAHIRVFGGSVRVRDEIVNARTQSKSKAAQIKRIRGDKYADETILRDGEIGALTGLEDVRAGDWLGERPAADPPRFCEPFLRVKVTPKEPAQLTALRAALGELADESPSLNVGWIAEKREITVSVTGKIRAEILAETLAERYGIAADMGTPSVIYRETPVREAYGYEHYTMPKPCWAVVRFLIQPLPQGSGLVYESTVSEKKIAYRYQEHVRTSVPRALEQGLYGWQVTDLKVTLTDGEDHPQHTHPLDFFVATPMGIMDGLKNAGTRLLEPVLALRIRAPEQFYGKVTGELRARRAQAQTPEYADGFFSLDADAPAAECADLTETLASLTGGRAVCSARLKGYFPCPEGTVAVRERVGVDPLDRSKWILHARGAL